MSRIKTQIATYYEQKSIHYGIDKSRFDHTLSLLHLVHGQRILDIGCATGYLGKTLRNQNNIVIGVDISNSAIRKAKKVLDEAYVCDIESDALPIKKRVDLIILSEVIEHLFQPENTMRKILRVLKPGGEILISTPNIMYWGNRLSFLRGKFAYTNQGVFDKSHIHFFTFYTLVDLLHTCHLEMIAENNITGGPIGAFLNSLFPNMFASHLIILAKKPMRHS